MYIILIITIIHRFVSILDSPITSGRISAQPSPRVLMDWVISSNLNCVRLGWRTSARPIPMGRLRNVTSWETAHWRLMIESLMLLDCILADPPWWMCWLASFLHWIRTQMLILKYEIISIIVNKSDIMHIIQKKGPWIGPMWQEGELSSWCDGMIHLIESLYVGLLCLCWCYRLLNPGQTIEIIGIIQDIMRIIVFSQLKMWALLH